MSWVLEEWMIRSLHDALGGVGDIWRFCHIGVYGSK